MIAKHRVLLAILDGWGKSPNPEVSAIDKADTPYVDSLYKKYPNSELTTYGMQVGLPEGQMGNSEVGHLNIGAGRIVYQELARINKEIADDTLKDNLVLKEAIATTKANGKPFHLMGLVSDGGVHSHINHLLALCDIAVNEGLEEIYIHAFLDGRDTAPHGGVGYLKTLLEHIEGTSVKLATVVGRYYAMDRDKRWERTRLAYDLMVKHVGEVSNDILATIKERYAAGETDEFIKPIVLADAKENSKIKDGDTVLCFNFRTDRPRQITEVLTQKDHLDYGMKALDLNYYTMTVYDKTFTGIKALFTNDNLVNTLGEVMEKEGRTQLRTAETEKYAHVTFFFNGGREQPFKGEDRILAQSPKVATYDLKPEMSAREVADGAIAKIKADQPDFICLNFANTDMVGHTGVFEAAMKAATTVDACLKDLATTALEYGYDIIVIADHGNSDNMINLDGSVNTAHSVNPVPFIFISKRADQFKAKDGKLADIAPTILMLMDIEIPTEMDGEVLLEKR